MPGATTWMRPTEVSRFKQQGNAHWSTLKRLLAAKIRTATDPRSAALLTAAAVGRSHYTNLIAQFGDAAVTVGDALDDVRSNVVSSERRLAVAQICG